MRRIQRLIGASQSNIKQEFNDVPMDDPVLREQNLITGNHVFRIVVLYQGIVSEFTFPIAVIDFIRHLEINPVGLVLRGYEIYLLAVNASIITKRLLFGLFHERTLTFLKKHLHFGALFTKRLRLS